MSHVVVSNVAFGYPGADQLFFDVSFRIAPGEHAAIIGDNGTGKSTLVQVIAGLLTAEEGEISVGGRTLYMPQDVGVTDARTIHELLLSYAPPLLRDSGERMLDAERRLAAGDEAAGIDLGEAIGEWSERGGYELEATWDASARRILRLSFADIAERWADTLSGGERKQLVLDVLLNSDADILLLDEPDNYLDIAAKRWLEAEIVRSRKTIVTVSHDRHLLSAAIDKIVTLEASGATAGSWTHGGSYATYADARTARQEQLGDDLKRWQDEERRLFHHYKIMKQRAALNYKNASRADAAESRWERFVAAGPPPPPIPDQRVKMRLRGGDSARRVVALRGVGLDGMIAAYSDEVMFGERIGLVGPNGSGKSHLLRLIAGTETPSEGEVVVGNRVSPGLFTQVNARPDFAGRDVGAIVVDRVGELQGATAALARYGIHGAVRRPYETLSGGQKARLEILCLELEGHNLLLLDEPTDNLDIASCEALEGALDGFTGTVVAISHDRTFLAELDRFWLLDHDGSCKEYLDYDSVVAALTK